MPHWFSLRQPHLKNLPFVLRTPSHGRMVITATNVNAEKKGIAWGTVLADARAIIPELEVLDDKPELAEKLLTRLAEWCIRFTPIVAIDDIAVKENAIWKFKFDFYYHWGEHCLEALSAIHHHLIENK
jgi:hypothetical protein